MGTVIAAFIALLRKHEIPHHVRISRAGIGASSCLSDIIVRVIEVINCFRIRVFIVDIVYLNNWEPNVTDVPISTKENNLFKGVLRNKRQKQ